MQTIPQHQSTPSRSDIACLAYQIWEAEGRPDDSAVRHWLEAEGRLLTAQLRRLATGNSAGAKDNLQRSRYGLVLGRDS